MSFTHTQNEIDLHNDILKVKKKWNWCVKNGEKGWYIQASSAFLDAKLTSNRPPCCWRTSFTTEAREKVKTGSAAITWPQETQKKKKKKDQADGRPENELKFYILTKTK